MIYFIECAGRVKVGFSLEPKARVRKIAVDAPFPCELIGILKGDRKTEAGIHERWRHLRCHGEWFAISKEFRAWIEENAALKVQAGAQKLTSNICGIPVKRGDKLRVAKAIGITPGAVSQWHKIPAEYCGIISDVTGVQIDVLRPDIFGNWQGGVQ